MKQRRRFILVAVLAATILAAGRGSAAAPGGAGPRRTISLDGIWQVAEGGMDSPPAAFDHAVAVPGLADMASPAFSEVGRKSDRRQAFWYRRTLTLEGPVPPVARLKIHKAAFGTKVWINGHLAGEHLPCFTPGWFDVGNFLLGDGRPNEVVIRVGASPGVLPATMPTGFDFEKVLYIPGIYDSVELILSGSPYIVRTQVVPDLETRSVRVVTTLASVSATATGVACEVREAARGTIAGRASSSTVPITPGGEVQVEHRIPIQNCRSWSPEDPFLYRLTVSTDGDRLDTRFGMRTFRLDSQTGRAMLNGRPCYLRGTNICIFRFFEDPGRGRYPWDLAWVRRVLQGMRDMNWNSARFCIGFPPEPWYELADELGILVQDEFPLWHGDKMPREITGEQLAREYREWLRERWNHPCVVIWDAQNETVAEQTGQAIQAVRSDDLSNRPWDNGWSPAQAPGDVFECHPYVFASPEDRLSVLSLLPATHLGNPIPNKGGNAMIINEYCWLWLNRDGTPTTLTSRVYESLVGADVAPGVRRRAYARSLAALTEYWRASRRFAGVLHFCSLTYSRPGGQTCDNYTNLDSLAYEPEFRRYVRDAFAPVGLCIEEWSDDIPGGLPRPVQVTVVNDTDRLVQAEVRLKLLRAGENTPAAEQARRCTVDAYGRTELLFSMAIPADAGTYEFVAELKPPDGEAVRSCREFRVMTAAQRLDRDGIALGKPVTASSVVTVGNETYPARFAVDGNASTRWSSEFSDPQWIAIDLGEPTTVSRVELSWETAYAKAYEIQGSLDQREWTPLYRTTEGRGGRETIRMAPSRTRWLRVVGTTRATPFGYSLWEIRVFP